MSDVQMYALLDVQRAPYEAATRWKVLRVGRRGSKTRFDLYCALFGHGPLLDDGSRRFRGLVHGVDVAWVARDYKQADAIWAEEIRPRFAGASGCRLAEQDHALTFEGYGTLHIRSNENIESVRGIGKRLGGVIFDEAAHFDLLYAWLGVVRATLMDNQGWAIFNSTTNSGHDGNAAGITPSFFNRLCAEIMAGTRGEDWGHWHWDARSNEKIDPEEFRQFVAEYDDTSATLRDEEVYALLLQAGAGLAFPEWDRSVHVRAIEPGEGWGCAGGMDWGYGTPGWFGIVYFGPAGRRLLRSEYYFDHTLPSAAGREIARRCLASPIPCEYVAADVAMWDVRDGGPTIAEKVQEGIDAEFAEFNEREGEARATPQLAPAPKGADAIKSQTLALHEVLTWERQEGVIVRPPKLTVHPDCAHFTRTVAVLPLDPKDPEKFDTKREDHPVQGYAYLELLRGTEYVAPEFTPEERAQRAALDTASRREADRFAAMVAKAERRMARR